MAGSEIDLGVDAQHIEFTFVQVDELPSSVERKLIADVVGGAETEQQIRAISSVGKGAESDVGVPCHESDFAEKAEVIAQREKTDCGKAQTGNLHAGVISEIFTFLFAEVRLRDLESESFVGE